MVRLAAMPALTRRRDPDAHQEAWRVHYGDVHVGTIAVRSGMPATADQWEWSCGFYPLSRHEHGTAPDFFKARAAFEAAWRRLLPEVTQADFDEHRRHRASTAWKYAMWDAGCKMPTQMADGRSRCFCRAAIDIQTADEHIYTAHLEMR